MTQSPRLSLIGAALVFCLLWWGIPRLRLPASVRPRIKGPLRIALIIVAIVYLLGVLSR